MSDNNRRTTPWDDMEFHKTLPETLDRIAVANDLERLPELLAPLAADLEAHFAEEEGPGGLFEQLRADAPHTDPKVQGFEAEHRALLAALRDLRTQTDEAVRLRAAVDEARRALVHRLRRHHAAEEALVLEAYTQDIGGE
ncbi:MAG: hypothetical protein D6731_19070 [Planctomycetota bacterium]|nr:MAG: hypothetical protein D6731_19070 [Planctomycetota bacterium]